MNAHRVEARRWLQQAQDDLEVVRTLRASSHFAPACFHSQQAAEKALKAALFSQGARAVLGHAVADLARQCENHDPRFGQILEAAALLDQFYIPTRYPNGLPAPSIPSQTYSQPQAEAAQAAAEQVVRTVETFLGEGPRPTE